MGVLVRNDLILNEILDSARSQHAHVITLEYTKKTEVFCIFQGVWNENNGQKWVKTAHLSIQSISIFKITCSNSTIEALE